MRSGISNRDFSLSDKQFQDACQRANVKPTKRQASKYRRGQGSAFKARQS